jgi:hypothetical protein
METCLGQLAAIAISLFQQNAVVTIALLYVFRQYHNGVLPFPFFTFPRSSSSSSRTSWMKPSST